MKTTLQFKTINYSSACRSAAGWFIRVLLCNLFVFTSCKTKQTSGEPLFELLEHKRTGLTFRNDLKATPSINMFKYMYFYNGAGVGAGDFNNDGLTDLFFSANQGKNALYLNKGDLQFIDVTNEASIPQDDGWSTGVSIVDINSDGLLDIYICRVGNYETLQSRNQFLICTGISKDGIPSYRDEASRLGVAFSGFSTQSAFLDFDLDGDLDMYLMNHSLRFNGTFNQRDSYINTVDSLGGDYFFRNDGNKFTDITKSAGILSYIIGYGLGLVVADVNLDGYPDIYVGNDFHENDYLYINQRNGTFRESLQDQIMHTSQFSMGVDIADITNDGYPEIITVDMLPEDPYMLKRSLGEDAYDLFHFKLGHGYNKQFARNTLQLNMGNGMFSEIGRYSNVSATDWSWAALWIDFDNDGWKDLFISNGIPKRLNDMDYVNHLSNEEIQRKIRTNRLEEKDIALEDKFPEIKLKNKFYLNKGNALFDDMHDKIRNNLPTFSNGSAYADLDNDGDLDIVVNNINDPVLIYKNTANDRKANHWLELRLEGNLNNINATGAKAIVYVSGQTRIYEKSPVRGFQGSMEVPLHIGLGNVTPDSILLVWPDNSYEKLEIGMDAIHTIKYKKQLPVFDYTRLNKKENDTRLVKDITAETGLLHKHEENPFNEFDREPLIPHMVSREGPALAVADINKDGFDDVFIGSSKTKKSALFLQITNGRFVRSEQAALNNDSTYEDVDATWTDVNADGSPDLLIASGGNEYYGNSEFLQPRVYLNNGRGDLTKLEDAFGNVMLTASCIEPYDFTGDGHMDLFVGGRAVPWEYGLSPRSYLLMNDGNGFFKDVTNEYALPLANIGLVKNAHWTDLDNDNDKDLVVSLEWDGICAFVNQAGKFEKKYITTLKGWWNFTLPLDADGDGDIDLIAGNLGWNSRLKPTQQQPIQLYYYDFDENGKKEQILTYHLGNKKIPFANKDELQKQLPVLRKKFFYAEDFAKASLEELFRKDKLRKAEVMEAHYFSNAILINNGNWNFTVKELPWLAQLTSYRDAVVVNANKDNKPDIMLSGNYYHNNIQMGQYDADYGSILINKGDGNFEYKALNGVIIKGEARHVSRIGIPGKDAFIIVRNNDSCVVLSLQ